LKRKDRFRIAEKGVQENKKSEGEKNLTLRRVWVKETSEKGPRQKGKIKFEGKNLSEASC